MKNYNQDVPFKELRAKTLPLLLLTERQRFLAIEMELKEWESLQLSSVSKEEFFPIEGEPDSEEFEMYGIDWANNEHYKQLREHE